MPAETSTPELITVRPLMTEAQAAEMLAVRRNTLARWRMVGDGPKWIVLNGRAIRYRFDDLDAYLKASTKSPEAIN